MRSEKSSNMPWAKLETLENSREKENRSSKKEKGDNLINLREAQSNNSFSVGWFFFYLCSHGLDSVK